MLWQLLLELTGGSEAGELGRVAYHELSGLVPSLTVAGAAFGLYWHHRCFSAGCWRPGQYRDPSGQPACARHRNVVLHRPLAEIVAEIRDAYLASDAEAAPVEGAGQPDQDGDQPEHEI